MNRVILRLAAVAIIASAALAGPAGAQTDIGGATTVQNRVEGVIDGIPRTLQTDARVFADEMIASHSQSSATLRFADETTMSIGPSSEVVLDRFIYDPERRTGDIVFDVAKGAFRFVTGQAGSGSHRVVTPDAVIGTRGTDYGVYALSRGTVTITYSGNAFMCPTFLFNAPSPDGVGCCNLDASEGAVFGIMQLGETECTGPHAWTGTSPQTLLSRVRDRRDRTGNRDHDPVDQPSNDPGPTKSNDDDSDDSGSLSNR